MQNKLSLSLCIYLIGFSILIYATPDRMMEEGNSEELKIIPRSASFEVQRWVELVVCVDKEFILQYNNDTMKIIKYVSQVIHGVNKIYMRHFNISIVLTNITFLHDWDYDIEATTTGEYEGEFDYAQLLTNFHQYRQSPEGPPSHDYAVLLSGKDFYSTVIGYASLPGMAIQSSAGLIAQTQNNITKDTFLVTHEMGHGFNMQHDGQSNSCDTVSYIMSPVYIMEGNPPDSFSTCSIV